MKKIEWRGAFVFVVLPGLLVAAAIWFALAVGLNTGSAQDGLREVIPVEKLRIQLDDTAQLQLVKFRDGDVTCYVGMVKDTFNTLMSCVK